MDRERGYTNKCLAKTTIYQVVQGLSTCPLHFRVAEDDNGCREDDDGTAYREPLNDAAVRTMPFLIHSRGRHVPYVCVEVQGLRIGKLSIRNSSRGGGPVWSNESSQAI